MIQGAKEKYHETPGAISSVWNVRGKLMQILLESKCVWTSVQGQNTLV